jgi:hypothetical protein
MMVLACEKGSAGIRQQSLVSGILPEGSEEVSVNGEAAERE